MPLTQDDVEAWWTLYGHELVHANVRGLRNTAAARLISEANRRTHAAAPHLDDPSELAAVALSVFKDPQK